MSNFLDQMHSDTAALNARIDQQRARAQSSARFEKSSSQIDSMFAGVEDTIANATQEYEDLLAENRARFSEPFKYTVEDFTRPFTEAYEKNAASYKNETALRSEKTAQQIEAFEKGSRDARPGSKQAMLTEARMAVGQEYSRNMLALMDSHAKNISSATMNFAQLESQYDLGQKQALGQIETNLFNNRVQLASTVASYTAQMAGVQAQLASAELGAAAQISTASIQASTQMAMQQQQFSHDNAMADRQEDWFYEMSDYQNEVNNYWDDEIMNAIDDSYMSFMSKGLPTSIV